MNRRASDKVSSPEQRWQLFDRVLEDVKALGRISPSTWAMLSERDREFFAPQAPV